MLSVDSPKWAELECDRGSAQPVADALKNAYEIAANSGGDSKQLQKAVDLAQRQIDCLYHQQSVYSGSAAAIPHLVHFANLSPSLDSKTFILVMVGCMDFENAYDHSPAELEHAYSDAIHKAEQLSISTIQSTQLSEEQLDNLLFAIAQFRRTCVYLLRDRDGGDFECAGCGTELTFVCCEAGIEIEFSDSDEKQRIPVKPISNLDDETSLPQHAELAFFYRLAAEGNQTSFLNWLRHLLGTFQCPNCNTQQRIVYEND